MTGSKGYGSRTRTVIFERIAYGGIRNGSCPTCGKKSTRKKTFTMTVSPFNTNPDGSVRTRQEVYLAVKAEAIEWGKSPAYHTKCEPES